MIKRTGLLAILVSMLISTAVFADDEYVANQAIVGYLRIDGQGETYNPSSGLAKFNERTEFCGCLTAVEDIFGHQMFPSCAPIHPVLPNLPQSFINNHILNKMFVTFGPNVPNNFPNISSIFQFYASESCRAKYSVEYSTRNNVYSTDLPDSVIDPTRPGGTGSTAGTGEPTTEPYIPNDTYFLSNEQWGLRNATNPSADINASYAWRTTKGSDEIVVAVIDTGVDYNHPDLQGRIWRNVNDPLGDVPDSCDRVKFPEIELADDDCNGCKDDEYGCNTLNAVPGGRIGDRDVMDRNGHGTEMAGVIAATMDNGIGVTGVCSNCKIMPLRVADGGGDYLDTNVSNAIAYAVRMGADVINMSFFNRSSGANPDNPDTTPYAKSYRDLLSAYQQGVVLVASAGNYPYSTANLYKLTQRVYYPAVFGSSPTDLFDIIAVSATDDKNDIADGFSCRGNSNCSTVGGNWVDLSAPGLGILSTVPASFLNPKYPGYEISSGSSYAAAHVSGVAALIKSRNPDWLNSGLPNITNRCPGQPNQLCFHDYVREIMMNSATDLVALGKDVDIDNGDPGSGPNDMGAGLLDAYAAVSGVVPVPPNQAPEWIGVDTSTPPDGIPDSGSVQLHSNKEARFNVLFNDLNGDRLTVTMQAAPGLQHAIFDGTKFSWTANSADMLNPSAMVGYYDLRFTADDGRGGVVQSPLVPITIPKNRSPYFLSALPANIEVHLGDLVDFTLSASDPDKDPVTFHPGYICNAIVNPGDPISCHTISLPANSTLVAVPARNPQARFTWRPLETSTCVNGSCPMNMLSFYASDRGPVVFDANGYLVDDPIINPAARLTDGDGTWIQVTATNEAPLIDPGLPSTVVVNGTQLNFTASDAHNDSFNVINSALPIGGSLTRSGSVFTLAWPFPQPWDLTVTFTAGDYFTDPTTGQINPGMSSQKTVTLDFDTSRPYANISSPRSCVTYNRTPFSATVYDDRALGSYTLKLYRGVRLVSGAWTYPEPPLDSKSLPLSGLGPTSVSLTPSSGLSYTNYRYTYQFKDAQSNLLSGYRDFTVKTSCSTSGGGGGGGGGPVALAAPTPDPV